MDWIVLSLLAFVSRLTLGQQQELCYWIEDGHSWSSGTKATLNIKLDKDYEDWQVTWTYQNNIINLEAWKGDVQAYSQSNYTITSRCYNGKLYACETLSIPFIIRYVPEEGIPPYSMYLNGVLVPPCNMTELTTQASCPYDSYTNYVELCQLWTNYTQVSSNPVTPTPTATVPYSSCPYSTLNDNILACELWCNILYTGYSTECTGTPSCPYDSYVSPHNTALCALWTENTQLKQNGLSPYTNTGSTTSPITCIYETSLYSSDYCYLWCENQNMQHNTVCANQQTSTYDPCPYLSYADKDVLCQLWGEINVAQQNLPTDSFGITLPVPTDYINYSNCPHNSLTDAILACYLWCELNAVNGVICNNPASCPYENYPPPNDYRLCELWYENLQLKTTVYGSSHAPVGTATPIFTMGPQAVECIFLTYSYATEHCTLWCENELIKYGSTCTSIPNFVTDASGNQITGANGSPLTQAPTPVIITDANGNTFTDVNGAPLTLAPPISQVTVTDISGNPVTDPSGNPVTEIVQSAVVTDSNGNAITGIYIVYMHCFNILTINTLGSKK